jgi:histone-lysine N-methyltransferase SETMAR
MGTIHRILHEDLGLEKMPARWVPKLLSLDQKDQGVENCSEFVAGIHCHSLAMLGNIVTMDETMVSYHTPEAEKQSKQWISKGKKGPTKARVQASRTKQMILAFFDNKGLVYSHIVARGGPINANYVLKVLWSFMKQLKKKRPAMVVHGSSTVMMPLCIPRQWSRSGWPVHNIQVIRHPPYSPDLAPVDIFHFRRVKEQLVGLTLVQNKITKTWEGVTRAIAPEEFVTTFRRWYERCQKCVEISSDYVKKS